MRTTYQKVLDALIKQSFSRDWFEGCHKHRIVPGYKGGKYADGNVVYLTQKEHSIVHYLMWKLYGDSRDKRAYKMIGVGPSGLNYQDRVDHGNMCVIEKIGFHKADSETRKPWQQKGIEAQKKDYEENGTKNWYYWSTPEGRRERASLGGTTSYKTNESFQKQQSSFKDKSLASAASKKSAKKPVTDGNGKMLKFHTELDRMLFLIDNPEWRKGCPTKKERSASVK